MESFCDNSRANQHVRLSNYLPSQTEAIYIYIYVGEICFSVYVENERDKRDVGKMCVNVILFLVRRMI